jgi:hypothetical protein
MPEDLSAKEKQDIYSNNQKYGIYKSLPLKLKAFAKTRTKAGLNPLANERVWLEFFQERVCLFFSSLVHTTSLLCSARLTMAERVPKHERFGCTFYGLVAVFDIATLTPPAGGARL